MIKQFLALGFVGALLSAWLVAGTVWAENVFLFWSWLSFICALPNIEVLESGADKERKKPSWARTVISFGYTAVFLTVAGTGHFVIAAIWVITSVIRYYEWIESDE